MNKNWQKNTKKNDNFSHFAKHRLLKNMLLPPFDPKLVFFLLAFYKKNIDVEQKQNLKAGKKQR